MNVGTFFSSEKPYIELQKTCFIYGIDPDNILPVAKIVGEVFVRDVPLKDLPEKIGETMKFEKNIAYGFAYQLNKTLFRPFNDYFTDADGLLNEWQQFKKNGLLSEEQAMNKVLTRDPWILEIGTTEKEENKVIKQKFSQDIVQFPLLQALSKYENLGNQIITSERIKVKSQPESVRPSLFNWLKYYRDELGIGQHSSVERGEFLFRSENCRKLSAEERERISLILKSVEEYAPLAIDTSRQEIVFPVFQGAPANVGRRPDAGLNTLIASAPAFPAPAEAKPRTEKTFPPIAPNVYIGGGLSIGSSEYADSFKPAVPASPAVSFSAGHIFPAEKEVAPNKSESEMVIAKKELHPASSPTPQAPPSDLFYIRPMSQGGRGGDEKKRADL